MNTPNRRPTAFHRSLITLIVLTVSAFAQDARPAVEKARNFEATSITGAKVRFPDDYKGKIVMLDFWATWCGPCIGEVPNLVKVFADLNPKGFEVLSVSLDSDDKKLPEFAKSKSMTWTHVCDGRGGPLAKLYDVKSIPTCYLVDGTTGKVLATSAGLRGAALRPTVEKALGLPPSNLPPVAAQPAPGKPPAPPARPDPLVEIAAKEVKSGLFLDHEQTAEQLKTPKPGAISLVKESGQARSSRDIAKLARAAHLRAGWFFHCTKCEKWHLNLAGAYAIAPDVVATAHHVLVKPANLKEGWLIVADEQNKIYQTKSVLGADASADTAADISAATALLVKGGLPPHLMVDCSHANSGKDPSRQPAVAADLAAQMAGRERAISAVMIESNLLGGAQDYQARPLAYGRSITDGCLSWEETLPVLAMLADAVRERRKREVIPHT